MKNPTIKKLEPAKYLNKKDISLVEYMISQKRYRNLYDFLRLNRYAHYINRFQEWAYKLMLLLKDDPLNDNEILELCKEIKLVINYIKNKQLKFNAACSSRYYHRKKRLSRK